MRSLAIAVAAALITAGCSPGQSVTQRPEEPTLATYHQLRRGMTLSEVEALVGRPGRELSSSDLGSYGRIVHYVWDHPSGGSMTVVFQNGSSTNWSQALLPPGSTEPS